MRYLKLASSILVGLTVVVVIAGCSKQRDLNLRYSAEKKLHQSERALQHAQIRGDFGKPDVMKSLEAGFNDVSRYCIAALDSLTPDCDPLIKAQVQELAFQSTTRLSQFLFNSRQYDSCVTLLTHFSERVKLPPLEAAVIWVNIGQAYQAKGEWENAVGVFNKALALTDPPLDQAGEVIYNVFNLPAHMYSIYTQIGDSTQALASFQRAIAYYKLFVQRFDGTRLATSSHANLAALYSDRQLWREAIAELGTLKDSSGQVSWEARIRIADIFASDLKLLDSSLVLYDAALADLTGADTAMRPVLDFKKSLVLMMQKKYDGARQLLSHINQNYPGYFAANPMAQLAKARSFDEEGNWERAETEYRFLVDNYAGSDEAMTAYLYLGDQFKKRGRPTEADRWLGRADAFYQQVADRNRGTGIEARAMAYQAELRRRDGDFGGAVTKLMSLFERFPNSDIGQRAAIAAASLTRDKLADSTGAEAIIGRLKRTLTDVAPPSQD
jgi:tetratricopeptide (TPR) repeat protein